MNNLGSLNNFLFEQLERLNDADVEDKNLDKEIERSKAVSQVAQNIIKNANIVLQAEKFKDDRMNADSNTPKMLEGQYEK